MARTFRREHMADGTLKLLANWGSLVENGKRNCSSLAGAIFACPRIHSPWNYHVDRSGPCSPGLFDTQLRLWITFVHSQTISQGCQLGFPLASTINVCPHLYGARISCRVGSTVCLHQWRHAFRPATPGLPFFIIINRYLKALPILSLSVRCY